MTGAGTLEVEDSAGIPTEIAARNVTLTLCTRDGELLGDLKPFIVPTPHLQDVDLVVREAE